MKKLVLSFQLDETHDCFIDSIPFISILNPTDNKPKLSFPPLGQYFYFILIK